MNDLINKLPYFYDNGYTRPIIEAEQKERDVLFDEIKDTLEQCFVSTATWGLDYWEDMLFIPHNTSKSYKERRNVIYSKMRSTQTTTVEVIRQLAMSFFEVENVNVTEYNSEYYFDIELENAYSKEIIKGSDINVEYEALVDEALVDEALVDGKLIDDTDEIFVIKFTNIENSIDLYKPAHLNYTFTFTLKSNVQINTNQRVAYSYLPICNVTKVGTWWRMYADGSSNSGKVIQSRSYDGYSKLNVCGVYKCKIKGKKGYATVGHATVGYAIVGYATIGGD